jgi:hypothetical protein
MASGYFNPRDAADYIQATHNIVYAIDKEIDSAIIKIAHLSEVIISEEDLKIADEYLLEIYTNSVKLQVILIEKNQLEKMISEDYGEDFLIKLELKTDRVYHLCQYLSKRHDIKADRSIHIANKCIIFCTCLART